MSSPDSLLIRLRAAADAFPRIRLLPRPDADRQRVYQIDCTARLEQAWYALSQFREDAWPPLGVSPDVKVTWTGPQFEYQRFYAEAFYYFAWRFRGMARKLEVTYNGQTLKPFGSFEVVGIRTARNQFIEHSDGKAGIVPTHFVTANDGGYVMQPFAVDGTGRTLDRGLYPNAEEFIDKVERRLAAIGIIPAT